METSIFRKSLRFVTASHAILVSLVLITSGQIAARAAATFNPANAIEVTKDPDPIADSALNIKPPRIAVVLGGGGCKALAQIGVLEVFAENHIPVDYVVGTSIGAIIGSLYAAGVPLTDIEQMFYTGKLQHALIPHMAPRIALIIIKKLLHLEGKKSYAGITSGRKLEKFLHKYLPPDFANLKIPFAAIATDLESGNTCMLNSGDLCKSVVASSAIPPMVKPITIGDTIFIDGGLKANLPTNCAQLTGADIIIAIPADAPIRHVAKRKFTSASNLAIRITDIMETEIDRYRWKQADLVIYPELANTPGMTKDPEIIKRTITAGQTAAIAALPQLKQLLKGQKLPVTAK